jgi:hypothetical protein
MLQERQSGFNIFLRIVRRGARRVSKFQTKLADPGPLLPGKVSQRAGLGKQPGRFEPVLQVHIE